MTRSESALARPLQLPCGLCLPNRVALAPLTNTQSHSDGTLAQRELDWLERRAAGGFGWVSTCAAYVSDEAKAWDGQLGVAHERHLPGLRRLASALKSHGAAAIVQLHHAGAHASLAPDRLGTGGSDKARAATESDLERVIDDFVAAALLAQGAGFDGVEVHGANGYLFTQFLAPLDNPRTDRWGGQLENRARLLCDALRAVRAATRADFAVGVRISPVDHWTQRGLVLADAVALVPLLAAEGIDFLHLSMHDAVGSPPHEAIETVVTSAIRAALPPAIPLFSVGGIWTRTEAEAALVAGADVAVLGKAAIGNPAWPECLSDPAWEPVRPPWSRDHLRDQAVSERFIDYLTRWRTLVAEAPTPP